MLDLISYFECNLNCTRQNCAILMDPRSGTLQSQALPVS